MRLIVKVVEMFRDPSVTNVLYAESYGETFLASDTACIEVLCVSHTEEASYTVPKNPRYAWVAAVFSSAHQFS
jgi:hypothetical protein